MLFGGLGNDIYVINDSGQRDIRNLGEGTDLVNSSIDYILGANVEKLTLTEPAISRQR